MLARALSTMYFSLYQEFAKFSQPILLTFLMGFFEICPIIPTWLAWLLAAGTGLAAFTSSLVYHQVNRFISSADG